MNLNLQALKESKIKDLKILKYNREKNTLTKIRNRIEMPFAEEIVNNLKGKK